ncbi:hypothetical protein DY000_02019709 [Brassica cretica]|uniref:Uncharacterized protein n=1 Tax=Brassica cretica TaxID=69181 RepID=A0ABQ7D397_BRACR|nr:hypothetical protein DY000_02019709 [Brassica cretica]
MAPPSREKYSASEKGKGVMKNSPPSRGQSLGLKLMASAIGAYRGTLSGAAGLDLGQNAPVSDILDDLGKSGEIAGGDFGCAEDDGEETVAGDARNRSVAPESADMVWCRSIPFRLGNDGSIEQLLDLPPESSRPSVVSGQDWGDVLPMQSSVGTLLLLLKGCKAHGVTFIVPRAEKRPWSAPIGYHCVYESFFEEDSRLWFLIPHLITSYCSRRGIALTQLMIGVQPKPNGHYTVQMRSGLQILTRHPSCTKKDWNRYYFYVKADEFAFEKPPTDSFRFLWSRHIVGHLNTIEPSNTLWRDLPKVVVLSQQEWGSFDRKRIRRQRK